jgi:hypothetical protein
MRSPVFSRFLSDVAWMKLRSLWPDSSLLASRRPQLDTLPPHLLRDIGMDEQHPPDWKRDLF